MSAVLLDPTTFPPATFSPATAAVVVRPTPRTDPRRRGQLVLAARVVEKVAAQAASEVTAAPGRRGLRRGIATDRPALPKVAVELSADSADLALDVAVPYPGSVRQATQRVREHVTARVRELTGVEVRRVDIDVTVLVPSSGPARPALR